MRTNRKDKAIVLVPGTQRDDLKEFRAKMDRIQARRRLSSDLMSLGWDMAQDESTYHPTRLDNFMDNLPKWIPIVVVCIMVGCGLLGAALLWNVP